MPVAVGFRSLFGIPEVNWMVRGTRVSENIYWRRVLAYCLDGNLQAVLDEYGHVLPDWLGLLRQDPVVRAPDVAKGMYGALTIRALGYGYDRRTQSPCARHPPRAWKSWARCVRSGSSSLATRRACPSRSAA